MKEWIIANWIVPVAGAALTLIGGIALKLAARYTPWVWDSRIRTLIKGLLRRL